ncbi:hypothetical protein PR048_013785 [Dryococelus australis]|uniref:PiggyBac transposable element-derived protein domain-containing protein n=1 Tax=Dryococelus australis TaxID=614101 RepID=A0ABQ9HT66_9NEOP|nr:hypothetical protein PR048_013785 [Dryococelus australis]
MTCRTDGGHVATAAQTCEHESGRNESAIAKEDGVIVSKWVDNSVVSIASNCLGVEPQSTAKQYSQKEKHIIQVQRPYLIGEYSQKVGGVYRLDQNVGTCRMNIRNIKWYWPLLSWLIDVWVHNAWQLARSSGKKYTQLEFRREIVQVYLSSFVNTSKGLRRPSTSPCEENVRKKKMCWRRMPVENVCSSHPACVIVSPVSLPRFLTLDARVYSTLKYLFKLHFVCLQEDSCTQPLADRFLATRSALLGGRKKIEPVSPSYRAPSLALPLKFRDEMRVSRLARLWCAACPVRARLPTKINIDCSRRTEHFLEPCVRSTGVHVAYSSAAYHGHARRETRISSRNFNGVYSIDAREELRLVVWRVTELQNDIKRLQEDCLAAIRFRIEFRTTMVQLAISHPEVRTGNYLGIHWSVLDPTVLRVFEPPFVYWRDHFHLNLFVACNSALSSPRLQDAREKRGRGGVADYSHPINANQVRFPAESHVVNVVDVAGGRRLFSGHSQFLRSCIPALLHHHLADLQVLVVKRRLKLRITQRRNCVADPLMRACPFSDWLREAVGTGLVSDWLLHDMEWSLLAGLSSGKLPSADWRTATCHVSGQFLRARNSPALPQTTGRFSHTGSGSRGGRSCASGTCVAQLKMASRICWGQPNDQGGETGGNLEVLKHAKLANHLTAGFCGLSTVDACGMEWNSIGNWKQWRQPSLVGQRIRLHNW